MKILHTSDWHLGKRLDNYSRHAEQVAVLNEIEQLADAHNPDALIVAGDLFDAFNPPVESIELFYKALKRMTRNGERPVICIAGNHDSPDRIEAPDPLAQECGIIFTGYPGTEVKPFELESGLKVIQSEPGFIEIQLPKFNYPLRLLLTPYANEYRFRTFLGTEDEEEELRQLIGKQWNQLAQKYCNQAGVNVLVSHLFMAKRGATLDEEPDDEKPILHVGGAQVIYTDLIPETIQYVALGHLHRHHWVDENPCPVVYSGSPIAYSFSEANQEKFISMLTLEPGQAARVEKITITSGKRLLRKKANGIAEALEWLSQNTDALVELTLVTDNYLNAADRKMLSQAHAGIISIIPEVQNPDLQNDNSKQIDLSQSMEALFTDYFTHIKGVGPNAEILEIFKEVLANDSDE